MSTLTDEEWEQYKTAYQKSYASAEEDAMRRGLLAKSKQFIEEHNKKFEAGEVTYTCGLNHFADFTEEENKRMFLGIIPPQENVSDE